jgi:alpha-tubulin suppressor-like RCC1 family protein
LAHSFAIGADCTLYTWGQNSFGQLGLGSFINQTNETPVQNLNTLCSAFTNQAPFAFSPFLVATQHTIVPITLTASDPDNDPLTYRIVMPPSLGYLTGAPPNVLYISTTNFLTTVTDRFTFVANDGYTDSLPATVTLLLFPPGQSSNTLPVVTITSTDALASEFLNSDGTTNTANFMIRRSGATNGPLDVLLAVIGTAHYGVDYHTLPPLNVSSNSSAATVSMPIGSSSVSFTLYGNGHTLASPPATAVFTIAASDAYTLGSPNQASISIINSNQPSIAPSRIFFPPDGSVFASPLDIELRVTNTNVSNLKLYADSNLLASTTAPPGSVTFLFSVVSNFLAGPHTVYSVANNSLTSAPVHFFVIGTNVSGTHSPSLGTTPTANSSFVVDANGALFDWGFDGSANLGDGGVSNTLFSAGVTLPVQIPLPASGAGWAKVSAGGYHTLALDSLGNVYAAGDNSAGQLGVGRSSTTFTNVLVSPARIIRCKDVAAGNYHSLALTIEGQIYAWGHNDFGQLGIGTTTNAPFPRLVSLPPGVSNWTAIAAGNYHSLALGNDGNAYAWGEASFGLLGNGGATNASIPQRVTLPAGVTNWIKIAAGGFHNLALAGNGKLYAWGYGGSGQLGYGGTADSSVPIAVNAPSNVANWAAISAGIIHSLALAEDGSLYGWGDNFRGELGPNASTLEPMPFLITPPSGVESWQQISAGAFHSLAISDSCMLYSWGSNSLGQLGVGSFAKQTSLQLVHNLDDLCTPIVTETNHAPSFVKGPDITVPENAGIQVFTNWATQINPGAPSETNQTLTFIVTNDNPHLFSTQPGIVPSGNLFFAGAPNSNGIAHVTVTLKDNGGTANGGQDTSAPQSFVIRILPPNHAPVPVVRVFPSFVLSSNYSALQVISPNGSNAIVYFDASLSSDIDGDPLTFAWFDHGTNHLFGSTVVATNVLATGTHSLTLAVSDGHVTVFEPFAVDVLSAGDAVGELINLIQSLSHSGARPNTWKQLLDSLQSAQFEFQNGLWNAGLVHTRIFESRVLAQIEPSDPTLANNLIYIAQQIIGVIQGNARRQPTISSLQNHGGNPKSLSFTGATGQIYLVQASSDLTHWETIGVASETDPGSFQFDDANSSRASARFYRLVVP